MSSSEDIIHTSKHIGMLEEGSAIQPGTIAFIVCLILVVIGFFVLLLIYIRNHQTRVREFEIELRKRKVLREREKTIALSEAEAERQSKRRLLEDQDIALRYRHVQGYEGYEDDDGSVSPLSASSPFAYSQPAGFSPKGQSSDYHQYHQQHQYFDAPIAYEDNYALNDDPHHGRQQPLPPPATTVSQTRWGANTTTHREMAFSNEYTPEYDVGGGGGGPHQQVIYRADGTTTRWSGGGGGVGVRLFDPDEAHSVQMSTLPRRPDPSYY